MVNVAQLAFVAGPATSPTTNLLLTAKPINLLRESFSLGAPTFEGEPYSVGAEYGYRTVEFTLQITGTFSEMAAAQQAFARQLATIGQNWLMLRWSATSDPLFIRCWQSQPDTIGWQESGAGIWELPVSLTCDPFMYGAPEDISSFTITNDPSAGTNRMMFTLPTIKGDVETPLMLAQTTGPGITVDQGASRGWMQSYATYNPSGANPTHTFLARSLTELTSGSGVGTTVTAAGSNYIEGNYKQMANGTISSAVLFGSFSTALTPMPGTYRVLMRVVSPNVGGGSSSLLLKLRVQTDGSTSYLISDEALTTFTGGFDQAFLVDLGLLQFPAGAPAGAVGFSAASTTTLAPVFQVHAELSGGTNVIRFDELFLLPVDTTFGTARNGLVDFPAYSAALPNNVIVYDAITNDMHTLYDSSGTAPFSGLPTTATTMGFQGGMPMVRPGANNYFTFLYNALLVTGTTAFAGRYYPRYLHVRPDAD